MNRGIKTDDPDFNGNRLTGYWGGNGDPYLSIIDADTDDHINGVHSVRVAFSGGNFPTELKVMIGMLVNMMQRFEPYIDEHGRFNQHKQIRDILHGEFEDVPCNSFIHEARNQMNTYMSANGQHPEIYMLGCAVGIQWAAERIKDIINAPGTEEDFLKYTLLEKLGEMLRTG